MKQVTICGESWDVRLNTVESWKERLPEIVNGYDKENIWNMDETGIFKIYQSHRCSKCFRYA